MNRFKLTPLNSSVRNRIANLRLGGFTVEQIAQEVGEPAERIEAYLDRSIKRMTTIRKRKYGN